MVGFLPSPTGLEPQPAPGLITGGRSDCLHNENWWKEERGSSSLNPRKLIGLQDIHPGESVPVLQIPLRDGDCFEVDIKIKISTQDMPQRIWHVNVPENDMEVGALFKGIEISPEAAALIESKLKIPRIFRRPKPASPVAIELLNHIQAREDESTRGLAIIRRGLPGRLFHVAVIPSLKPGGMSPMLISKDEFKPAILELQQLGWLGNPHSDDALTLYPYVPEPITSVA